MVLLKDGIPSQFKLAGNTIKVRVVPRSKWRHGKDCVGLWDATKNQIDILATLDPVARQQTFCHEMNHAMLDVAGHPDLSQDENFVDRMAYLLHQALTTFE